MDLTESVYGISKPNKKTATNECRLFDALKLAYRKHCLGDETIGWDELDQILYNTISDIAGDELFVLWLDKYKHGEAI